MSQQSSSKRQEHRPIRVLSAQLANQIAAGEVVERPSSVVKELVENSIDAGANEIHIEIEQGGHKRILVRDNGKGINKDELALALSRHATSKISNIDDLDHISSMGFRGEALASISSISRLRLSSKPVQQSEAWCAYAEGAQMQVKVEPTAHPNGTSIEVVDLFFNTPARRKFLRSAKTEFQHIEQLVKRLALTQAQVRFTLVHNNKTVLKFAATNDLKKRVQQVCGSSLSQQLIAVDYTYDDLRFYGWCSALGHGLANRDQQYTFVNGRMMKDKLLAHALRQAYEETLPPQMFPAYVLFLDMPTHQLDINVHPAKHEVRFHHPRDIHDLVSRALTDAFGGNNAGESQQPNHDYIRPLQTKTESTAPSNSGFGRSGAPRHYHAPSAHVSNKVREANLAFLASAHQASNELSQLAQIKADDREVPRDSSAQCHYLLQNEHLVFSSQQCLQVVDVKQILSAWLQKQCATATQSHSLLMPVSIVLDASLPAIAATQASTQLCEHQFIIDIRHPRMVLKAVPEMLKDLPWSGIFAKIDWHNYADVCQTGGADEGLKCFSEQLAWAWQQCSSFERSSVDVLINDLGDDILTAILDENASELDLLAWIQSNV